MASMTARQAARSDPMKLLARLGLAARAIIYLLIGWFALLLAIGKRPPETDQRGAMQELVRHTGGFVLLWAIAIGLSGEGKDWKPRLQSLVRGIIYAFFAVNAFNLLAHAHSQKSQAGQSELFTAKAMTHKGGRIAVGIVGVIIIVVGLALVYEGVTRKFKKYFDLAICRHLVAGRCGSSARWAPPPGAWCSR